MCLISVKPPFSVSNNQQLDYVFKSLLNKELSKAQITVTLSGDTTDHPYKSPITRKAYLCHGLVMRAIQWRRVYLTLLSSHLSTWFNIKLPFYQYGNSHYKDKTASWPSYLYIEKPYTRKYGLYIETPCIHPVWYYTVQYIGWLQRTFRVSAADVMGLDMPSGLVVFNTKWSASWNDNILLRKRGEFSHCYFYQIRRFCVIVF